VSETLQFRGIPRPFLDFEAGFISKKTPVILGKSTPLSNVRNG
jgi:hypothetical protein